MAEGRALWQVKPFIVFFPAAFLSITVLAVNLVGDGLRDALDPRCRQEGLTTMALLEVDSLQTHFRTPDGDQPRRRRGLFPGRRRARRWRSSARAAAASR